MADTGWANAIKSLFGFLGTPQADYPTENKYGRYNPSNTVFKGPSPDFGIDTTIANAVPPPIPVEIRDLITKARPADANNLTGSFSPLYFAHQGLQDLDTTQADAKFNEALRKVENGPMVGRNDDGFWHPHTSPEGGLDTIGYGHKLTPDEVKNKTITLSNGNTVDFSDGLSDAEVTAILNDDIAKNRDKASKNWNSYTGKQGTPFDSLPREYQNVLTNIVFNAGSLTQGGKFQWPKLAEAIKNNDIEGIRKQMVTSYTAPSGKVKPLIKRANIIADALGLIPSDNAVADISQINQNSQEPNNNSPKLPLRRPNNSKSRV